MKTHRTSLILIATLAGQLASAAESSPSGPGALEPVPPNFNPGAAYADNVRIFQGIPGIEYAANGRLWALWYAGGPDEPGEGPGNFVVLTTSADDGKTWSAPKLVIDPPGPVRAYDPTLWIDPQGRLWVFWAQSYQWWDGRSGTWAMVTENPDAENPEWSSPRRLCDGIMMNKPTVSSRGEWLLPVSVWSHKPGNKIQGVHRHDLGDKVGAQVVVSKDNGATFSWLGQTSAPEADRTFDEHMIVERKDGSLWMLLRTKAGIAESTSTDGGKTWTPGEPSSIPHANARFFIRRLKSGNLLMVKHHSPDNKARSHLTATISKDDGKTWEGGLLLDERKGVSYPDGVQDDKGVIRIIYDYSRSKDKQILMAAFTETDALEGKPSAATRLRVLVNQATGIAPPKPKKENQPQP